MAMSLQVQSGLPTTPNGVEYKGKLVTVGAFPIGIDPEKFDDGLQKPKVQERIGRGWVDCDQGEHDGVGER